MTASQHTIAGTVLTMPVKIRKATQHNAMFAVDADGAQRLIDYSGLQVYRPLPRRAIVTLILTHFIDGDLGTYYEYSTCVMVKPPGAGAAALQSAFVQHMFVDQAFTLEAGRTIWGFPKVMSYFAIRECSTDVVKSTVKNLKMDDPCWVKAGEDLKAFLDTKPFQDAFLGTPAQQGAGSSAGMVANGQAAI